jgi:hypothetical protein
MTTQNVPTPDWSNIQLPDSHLHHLKQLMDDQEKLKRIGAVGLAIIHFMKSDMYADTFGVYLQDAYFKLFTIEDD